MNPQIAFLLNKGLESLRNSNLDSAELYLKQALRLQSNNPHVLRLLGVIAAQRNQYTDAIKYLTNSLKALPKNSLALSNLGNVYFELKEYGNALDIYDQSIKIDPSYEEVWSNKGNILYELKRYDEAIVHHDKALSLRPDYFEAWSNKGNVLYELKRYDEAIAHHDKALSLKPDYAEGWYNKGNVLHELKRYDEAITHYNKALSLKPDYAEGYLNKASAQLALGDFEGGWKNYEYRWKKKDAQIYRHPNILPLTKLSDIAENKILVWCDQYFGDSIQFSRYINELALLGADIIFEVYVPLRELFINSFPRCNVIAVGDVIPDIDYQIPVSSLPLLFSTTSKNIPKFNHYLRPSNSSFLFWSDRLKLNKNKLNVAIACAGNTSHYKNDKRPIKLELFKPIINFANLFLIQKDVNEVDALFMQENPQITFIGDEIKTFNDTAAIVDLMDLTISIDTSTAHLSAALGKPTWVLAPWAADWRWMLGEEGSPWYPTVKIFRQPAIDDWDSVIKKVELELSSKCK